MEQIHLNEPQLLEYIVKAQKTICLWSRATGKSEGPMSLRTIDNIHKMPRTNGFLMGTTYEQLLTRTLPPLIAGWERFGYYQNVHFWVKKFPAEKLKVPKAYRHPQTAEHYIQWYNGSGIYLVSQDRAGTMNGIRTQWGAADEARFLNKKRMDEEVIPTMAGHADRYGHLSNYLSLLFCSDMPRNSRGKWLLDMASEMDKEVIDTIITMQAVYLSLKNSLSTQPQRIQAKTLSKMKYIENGLNELRKNTTHVSYANTFDNIHVIGIEAIKNFKRNMSDFDFQISILNKQIYQVENGFYYALDEDKHGYHAIDYKYLDQVISNYRQTHERDCRWDTDVNLNEPLEIASDFNNSINSVVVGQSSAYSWKFLNSIYVLNPELLKECALKFCRYYRFHATKEVIQVYDNTAIGKSANSNVSFADEWRNILESEGWSVRQVYVGQASTHESRYYAWANILKGGNPDNPVFSYNKDNCKVWKQSCDGAATKQAGDVVKKDKSNEQDPNILPQEATHMSEAGDTLFMYWYSKVNANRYTPTERIRVA